MEGHYNCFDHYIWMILEIIFVLHPYTPCTAAVGFTRSNNAVTIRLNSGFKELPIISECHSLIDHDPPHFYISYFYQT